MVDEAVDMEIDAPQEDSIHKQQESPQAFSQYCSEVVGIIRSQMDQVLAQKKLILVLDLDHTLLHSVERTGAEQQLGCLRKVPSPSFLGPIHAGDEELYDLEALGLCTKLRPFAREFLQEASKKFNLCIYTMGDKRYALAMAHLLDPSGNLFEGRIKSREDAHKGYKTLDMVCGAESVAILDDTEEVWPEHRYNLFPVQRYYFFGSCTAKDDVTLLRALSVLETLYSYFFTDCMDVRSIVQRMGLPMIK